MAGLLDKVNTRLPGLLRPLSRLKTKLAGTRPVTTAKHFALWVVKLATVKRLKIGQRADRFVSETELPHTVLRSQLGRMVDTELHSRKVGKAEDIESKFETLGLKHGTEKTKAEAQAMIEHMSVLQGALSKYMTQVDEHLKNQEEVLEQVQEAFEDEVEQLEEQAWNEFQAFLDGKDAEDVVDYQSVHQLVMGTSHVQVGDGKRLQGLKHYVGLVKSGATDFGKVSGETDFEAALRYMKADWVQHRDEIKEQVIKWDKNRDRSSARKYQHNIAALWTIDRLRAMIDEPNKDLAREARQRFLGTYGEMFGVEGRKGIAKKHFQSLREIADERREKEKGDYYIPSSITTITEDDTITEREVIEGHNEEHNEGVNKGRSRRRRGLGRKRGRNRKGRNTVTERKKKD